MNVVSRAMQILLKPNTENVQNESHLRPVTHSPQVAFGVILTVLGLPGSGGKDALLSGVSTPHGPLTDTFATLDGALEDIREFA